MPNRQNAERPDHSRERDRRGAGKAGGKSPVLEPTEARQAVKLGTMRYVLLASLILAVILMAVVDAIWHVGS
jgi:hypothetical protein